jgi:hypothetical protein
MSLSNHAPIPELYVSYESAQKLKVAVLGSDRAAGL